nr:polysaccharide pyruvyl transferase family protein [Solirubrobacterales bacterium]
GRVAAFFSGGVDSWSTVLDNEDLTDLIFVRGIDLLPGAAHQAGLAEQVEERLREAAESLGKTLHVVDTNLRELSDGVVAWEAYYGCAVVAVALFMAPLFERVLIAGDSDYEVQVPLGANRLVDQLWSTEALELVDSGGRHSRVERVRRIVGHPLVKQTLRVCWENPGGAYNCGRCRKCLLTMATLEAFGAREEVASFPREFDLAQMEAIEIWQSVTLALWEDVLEAVGQGSNPALERAVGAVVASGKRNLGLPESYRSRRGSALAAGATPGPEHQIADLTCAPGALSFEARIGGQTRQLWIRTETDVTPSADAALAACLMPAMRWGGTLKMDAPVSPRLLRTQREFQAIQRAWSLSWEFDQAPLREVEVLAPARTPELGAGSGRVAAFFSGGVDSWSTVLDNEDLTDLIFVRGIDLLPGAPHQAGLAEQVEERLREAAESLGKTLHVVDTNLRELSDGVVAWEAYYGCAVVAVALFMAPLFERVLIAGDSDYEVQPPVGSAWAVDQLWSTERLQVVDDGGRFSREQRLRAIAGNRAVQRSLRVCWENPGGAYNCGRCRKCLLTKLSLEALGIREQFATFPPGLDLDLLEEFVISQPIQLVLWEDALETARTAGRGEIERAIGGHLARGRLALGLAPTYRSRPREDVESAPRGAEATSLFATPATAEAIADSRAIVVLVGSYDGSGNFGDIAQLDACLERFEALAPDLLVLPVLERAQMRKHELVAEGMLHRPAHVLYFDPGGEPGDGLVAVPAPDRLAFASCYLYGGGYLNPLWGGRKLAMSAAGESLLGGASSVLRLSSGLQVDPDWVAGMADCDRRALRAFDLLGSRDPRSTAALAGLGSATAVIESGDDAIGAMPANRSSAPIPVTDGHLHVSLHFADHAWVTDDPERMLTFFPGFLSELGRVAGRPVTAHPLLAYVDESIDERPGLERLAAICHGRGIELTEARILRPANLEDAVPDLRRSALTLSCSYHVALTSLMYEVPAILIGDNDYYEQKAAGLLDSFGLPAEFRITAASDPRDSAERVAALVLDEDKGASLQARLATSARSLRRRHESIETEILRRICRSALEAASAERKDPATAMVATSVRELAAARSQLATVLDSRSWRLMAPLRRIAALLRGRRGS